MKDKKFNIGLLILALIVFALLAGLIQINQHNLNEKFKDKLILVTDKSMEEAFGLGQVSALRGDIRIKKINESTYVWIGSPWKDKNRIPKDTIKINLNNK